MDSAVEIKLIVIPREDGGTDVTITTEINTKLRTVLLGFEAGKKQLFDAFTEYCKTNNIEDALEKYQEIKMKEIYL